MDWIQALLLGLIQGLTEYLPVSSSGHLTIGQELLGVSGGDNLTFDVAVHVATVLSTLVILWREIDWIFKGIFKFEMNEETKYVLNILVSMIPVGIVGVFFKDYVEKVFGSGLLIVGIMLLVTAALLTFFLAAGDALPLAAFFAASVSNSVMELSFKSLSARSFCLSLQAPIDKATHTANKYEYSLFMVIQRMWFVVSNVFSYQFPAVSWHGFQKANHRPPQP